MCLLSPRIIKDVTGIPSFISFEYCDWCHGSLVLKRSDHSVLQKYGGCADCASPDARARTRQMKRTSDRMDDSLSRDGSNRVRFRPGFIRVTIGRCVCSDWYQSNESLYFETAEDSRRDNERGQIRHSLITMNMRCDRYWHGLSEVLHGSIQEASWQRGRCSEVSHRSCQGMSCHWGILGEASRGSSREAL